MSTPVAFRFDNRTADDQIPYIGLCRPLNAEGGVPARLPDGYERGCDSSHRGSSRRVAARQARMSRERTGAGNHGSHARRIDLARGLMPMRAASRFAGTAVRAHTRQYPAEHNNTDRRGNNGSDQHGELCVLDQRCTRIRLVADEDRHREADTG